MEKKHITKIQKLRQEIDAVDEQLLSLLETRRKLSIQIGAIKKQALVPRLDKKRENTIIQNLSLQTDIFTQAELNELFGCILSICRKDK